MLDCYWNGGSPRTQNRYYDNFVISTRRIGPLASLAIQTIPSPPARYAVFRKDFNKPSGIFDIRGRRIAAANTWLTRAGMQKSSEAGLAADGVYLIVRKGNAYPLGEWQR